MTSLPTVPGSDDIAFSEIEAAVMETSRGRWFLEEFARRRRHADTLQVIGAIETLRNVLGTRPSLTTPLAIQQDLIDMARTLARTEREMRALGQDKNGAMQVGTATDELGSIVLATEQATSRILGAAERVQECAWTMREANGADADCDLLDQCATEIYTACGFQDLTAQRIGKVTEAFRFVDQRVRAILAAAGLEEAVQASEEDAPLAASIQRNADIWFGDAAQAEIDETLDFFVPAAREEPTMIGADLFDHEEKDIASPAQAVAAEKSAEPDAEIFADLDQLPTPEKVRAFR